MHLHCMLSIMGCAILTDVVGEDLAGSLGLVDLVEGLVDLGGLED